MNTSLDQEETRNSQFREKETLNQITSKIYFQVFVMVFLMNKKLIPYMKKFENRPI